MAHGKEQQRKGDHASTKTQEERDIRRKAGATGRERGAMSDTPDEMGKAPDADNTSDPKAFPSKRDRSGQHRKFDADEK
jgi:hypothetical protein